jgi:dienelactone hydrolase
VLPDSSGALSVRTHVRAEPDKAPVHVEVLAAGGRVVAARDEARGSVARFETGAWPDGAYEIRCTTRSAWDTPWFTHIAWYKGDPLAAARRLMAAARTAAADPTGATLRMLSEMVLDRLGGSLEATPDDAWMSLHAPLLEFEELELERAGTASRLRPSGFVRFAYLDDVDGAPQFCRTYLPPDYDPRRPSPLIVYLHGFNPFNPPYLGWWLVDQRHDTTADRHGVIFMEPHGRGNTSYEGIGDRDVLRCIDEARRQLAVDPDRVYLFGESMGGHGVWRVATRHPDLFAAIAPVFGGWDQRLLAKDGGRTPGATDWDRFLQEQDASFSGAESLLNVPVFIHHGDQDQGVSPEHSRFAARMLQRWGYDVRYHEHPGLGHEWLGVRDEIARWLLEHRRDPAPRHVRLRAATLGTAAAHWVRVEARESSSEFTLVDAAIAEPGVVRLDTRNAARIALAPPASLRGAGETLHVVWNGQALDVPLRDGRAVVGRDAGQGLVKRAGVEGPLPDVFTTPFAIVVGTASLDPLMRQRCQEKADAVAGSWRSWQHATPRLIKDSALTPADEQRYSLLLVGGADANSVTRRIAPRLPLKVEPAAITIDGRRFPATDAVVQMIYPSPFSTERYVVVVAATSADGLYFWTPPTPPGPSRWDFTLEDGRRVMLPEGTPADRGFVAAGVFDQRWRREDGLITTGDTALRSKSALRHAPRPGFVVAERVLDSYAGRYQFPWGLTVTLTRKARQLSVEGPGIPVGTLTAATETEFVLDTPAAELTFTRDAQGAVNGFLFYQGGRELSAQRLR